jgi:hypothetical protein
MKNVLKILIISLLFTPFILKAADFYVSANGAVKITPTTATLEGSTYKDLSLKFNYPTTTYYFRYSKSSFSCDYNSNNYNYEHPNPDTITTKETSLGTFVSTDKLTSSLFNQDISNLTPDTTYYYCAIVKETGGSFNFSSGDNTNIYGSSPIQEFKTLPGDSTVTTNPTNNNTGSTSSSTSSSNTNLTVNTTDATNITTNTAILNGLGGEISPDSLPITAYFRYSETSIPPIFCNDTYGINMISTGDISLVDPTTNTPDPYPTPFHQQITGLSPDTTYYYCAIISTKKDIAYGGSSIIKTFHTSPLATTITTLNATQVNSNSVHLNGSYSSVKNVETYFEYEPFGGSASGTVWQKVGDESHAIGTYNNLYGNLNYTLSGLSPNTKYVFKTVAVDNSGTIEGSTLNFTTSADNGSGNGVGSGGGTGGDNGGNSGGDNGSGGSSENTCPSGWTGFYPSCTPPQYGDGGSVGTGNIGIVNTPVLKLNQVLNPPTDAVVHFQEGIETVFARQIVDDVSFAKMYGYQDGANIQSFAWNLSDQFARAFGYVNSSGREIRVSKPDVAAYQLQFTGNKLTVYEYYKNKIIDIRDLTTVFKNASGYEYYFKKN